MRAFFLPALIAAFAFSLLVLKAYDALTRPRVPASVQHVVEHYTAPGIQIGATIRDIRPKARAPLTFVPHLGYVTHPHDAWGMSELRLLLSARDRTHAPNDADRVDAVELVTAASGAYATLASDLTTVFRAIPVEGCLTLPTPGIYREVHYWMARNSRGGVALTSDYGGNTVVLHPGMVTVSLLAFAGPFQGSATLRGNYTAQPCVRVARRPS